MACLQIFWIPIAIFLISGRFSWRVGDPTFPIVSEGHNPGMYYMNGVEHVTVKTNVFDVTPYRNAVKLMVFDVTPYRNQVKLMVYDVAPIETQQN